jgi:hypothetical protein
MATFQVVFELKELRDWDPANNGAEDPQECFYLPKIH